MHARAALLASPRSSPSLLSSHARLAPFLCSSPLTLAPTPPLPSYQPNDVTPNLVAFLLYVSGQIVGTSIRKKGHNRVNELVQGDMEAHTHWDAGISKALKFMKSSAKCPTVHPLIKSIQKGKKTTAKKTGKKARAI